jgi:hypothetical protein
MAERIAVRKVGEDSPDPFGEHGLRRCEACESTIYNVPDCGQRRRSSGRIDSSMDLASESTGVKYEPRFSPNDRQKIRPLQMFHHQARSPVDHNLLIDSRDGDAGRTGGFERSDLECQPRAGTRCTQQFQDSAVPPLEDLGFPALSDEAQATR